MIIDLENGWLIHTFQKPREPTTGVSDGTLLIIMDSTSSFYGFNI